MVSSSNIVLAGVALLVGFFVLRGSSSVTPSLSNAEIPQAFNIIQDPAQTLALPGFFADIEQKKFEQEVEIPFLQKLLSDAQSLFKNTFNTNPTPPCRTRACKFQTFPRGSRFTIDPFSGQRIALPVGARGGSKTEAFFGGAEQLQFNLAKVTQGRILSTSLSDLIADITNQLKIKQTISV